MTATMPPATFTVFADYDRLTGGSLADCALAVKRASRKVPDATYRIFDDATGRVVDVDLRGTNADMLARLPAPTPAESDDEDEGPNVAAPRRRGRPRLGVVAREVTLLPRHWEWLATQPGGASVALRKLVEEARRANAEQDRVRAAREATYRFLHEIGGNLPAFEEISRALFAGDLLRFDTLLRRWPPDVAEHAVRLVGDTSRG